MDSADQYDVASKPLPPERRLEGDEPAADQSPEDREARRWLREVYQGDTVRQLSVRSVVTGMLIGGVMSISNLYVGLKTGWGLGVTITACIIAYAVFRFLETIIPAYRRNPFTVLENYTMSSAASAAGYMSSAGLVSAIPALYMATGRTLLWWEMMSWLAAISVLGVFMAVPLKRQLINIEQLPFPSGIATAVTLKSMHVAGGDAIARAKALLWSAIAGAALTFWRDAFAPLVVWLTGMFHGPVWVGKQLSRLAFPESFPLFPRPEGRTLLKFYSIGFEGSLIMVAAGTIMGIRVGVSLLLGALVFYGPIAHELFRRGIVTEPGYVPLVRWLVWPSTALMVASSLLSFALRWKTVLRSFSGLGALLGRGGRRHDPLAHVEVPASWFIVGTTLSGLACILLGHYLFGINYWMGLLAVLVTFVLSIVAARATGETDVTPIGAMGKITQLLYGVVTPAHLATRFIPVNLMTASITAGAASHSADLLTDLKSGYLLGGNPRRQTISQLFGVLAGTLLCVPVYAIIVHDPTKLGSAEMPAPSAKVWSSVAQMLAQGPSALPQGALWSMAVGAVVGLLITLAEEFLPRRWARWVPSATGLGIAGVIPAYNSVSMFLGALAAWLWTRADARSADKYVIPISSGLIAGESLMGVAVILAIQGPGMLHELAHSMAGLFR